MSRPDDLRRAASLCRNDRRRGTEKREHDQGDAIDNELRHRCEANVDGSGLRWEKTVLQWHFYKQTRDRVCRLGHRARNWIVISFKSNIELNYALNGTAKKNQRLQSTFISRCEYASQRGKYFLRCQDFKSRVRIDAQPARSVRPSFNKNEVQIESS